MATATGFAYVVPNIPQFNGNGPPTTFCLTYNVLVGDGVQTPQDIGAEFVWDATQDVATNFANFKTAVSQLAAGQGFNVPISNILIFSAVT